MAAWTPRSATVFAAKAADAIQQQVAADDALKPAFASGKRFEMPKELPGAVQTALGKATSNDATLEKVRNEVVIHAAATAESSKDTSRKDSEPSDDQLWAEAGAVLAQDINDAIAANKQTWARALLESLREQLLPVLQQAVRENPSLMQDRKAFDADVKAWFEEAAMSVVKLAEDDGGDLALLKRGGFGQ